MQEVSNNEPPERTKLNREELGILDETFPPLFQQLHEYLQTFISFNQAESPDHHAHPRFRERMRITLEGKGFSFSSGSSEPGRAHSSINFPEIEKSAMSNTTSFRELIKTGSELYFLVGGSLTGIIFNRFHSPEAAAVWRALAKGTIRNPRTQRITPVAPILEHRNPRNGSDLRIRHLKNSSSSEVMSRYCGPTLFTVQKQLELLLIVWEGSNLNLLIKRAIVLMDELERQSFITLQDLAACNIRHGHPHPSNFTIEFYPTDLYRHYLAAGHTVNTLPPRDPETKDQIVEFNVATYLKDPSQYTPIVRLIDFDRAMQSNHWEQIAPFIVKAYDNEWAAAGYYQKKGILTRIYIIVNRFLSEVQTDRATRGPTELVSWALEKIQADPKPKEFQSDTNALHAANGAMDYAKEGRGNTTKFMQLQERFEIASIRSRAAAESFDSDTGY